MLTTRIKGKIKSIPITKEQASNDNQFLWLDTSIMKSGEATALINKGRIDELKTLVVEYKVWFDNDSRWEIKQLPIIYSQWQSIIDNGIIDMEIKFRIVEYNYKTNTEEPFGTFTAPMFDGKSNRVAKIVLEKNTYTKDELIEKIALFSLEVQKAYGDDHGSFEYQKEQVTKWLR